MSNAPIVKRITLHCVFTDAMATRAMIQAGGGTVISTKPMQVQDEEGHLLAGFEMSYDLPMLPDIDSKVEGA